jgi:hypothetical protein
MKSNILGKVGARLVGENRLRSRAQNNTSYITDLFREKLLQGLGI